MKINILDAHDRYSHFTSQNFDIGECCQSLIDQKPFDDHPFYIFAHTRTEDNGADKRLIWQPRLTKPKSQTNSMLFKAYPGKEEIKIIWMIPASYLWPQFETDKITSSQLIQESIYKYKHSRQLLDMPEDDDLTDEQINGIYRELSLNARRVKSEKEKQ